MVNTDNSSKKIVCCICGSMLLWPLGANATGLPPDPQNAALLYYQAFLLRPKADANTEELLDKVLHGAEPNKDIRQYLESCQKTIELAEAAAQMPQCNWGIQYSKGHGLSSQLAKQLNSLAFLLEMDARLLAADGDYRPAFCRCLIIRRLARHVGDDTSLGHMVSLGVDGMALRGIRHILETMPLDADTLKWLKDRLTSVRGAPQSPARAMEMDFKVMLQTIRTNAKTLPWLREELAKNAEDRSAKNDIRNLTDDEMLARVRKPYEKFLNSVLRAINSDMSYEEKHAEIQRLADKLNEQAHTNPAIILSMRINAGGMVGTYCYQIRHIAYLNALKAAIEIYLAVAKTGRLPDKLPDGLPKDPYSSQDFEYEKTKKGFVLRCRVKDIDDAKVQQYEFRVQR